MTVEVRALRKDDDRTSFRSGDDAIDIYFRRYAGQNQFRHHVGVSYVAFEASSIVGFLTVTPGSLDADDLPSGRKMPPYPVPVLRVARLATAEAERGRGVGKLLLRFAVELAEKLRDEVGCVGVVVDAKRDAAEFYARYGFVRIEASEGASHVRPTPALMFLPIAAVPRRGSP